MKKSAILKQIERVFDALGDQDVGNLVLVDGTLRGEPCGFVCAEISDEDEDDTGDDRLDDDLQVIAVIPKKGGKVMEAILEENGAEGPEDDDEESDDDESDDETEDDAAPKRGKGRNGRASGTKKFSP